jgi:hypothetical protein
MSHLRILFINENSEIKVLPGAFNSAQAAFDHLAEKIEGPGEIVLLESHLFTKKLSDNVNVDQDSNGSKEDPEAASL